MIKVGIALGSGGARGLAHIGVLDVLCEAGVPVDLVTGSSMGAVVGAIYACGSDLRMAGKLAAMLKERSYLDMVVPREGFIKGDKFQELIRIITKDMDFSQTRVPFACVAVDLENSELLLLREGKIHEAVRASISIPGIFVPHRHLGRMLVDGGVVERVPVHGARAMGADFVIGVDVGYQGGQRAPAKNVIDILNYTIELMQWEVARARASTADVMISPQVDHINPLSNAQAEECVELGRAAAMEALPQLKMLLENKGVQLNLHEHMEAISDGNAG